MNLRFFQVLSEIVRSQFKGHMSSFGCLFLFISLLSSASLARELDYPFYYTIRESSESASLLNRLEQQLDFTLSLYSNLPQAVPLTQWERHSQTFTLPAEPYSRKNHYGSWTKDRRDGQCFNTRARVLIRDSKTPVTVKNENPCIVETGTWYDPYTDQWTYSAKDLQVDHMLPLKHSYITGGATWGTVKRCLFANSLADSQHLIPVNGRSNAQKGDRGPDQYLPENSRYVCTYLRDWLRIKLIWGLVILPAEGQAIEQAIHSYRCDPSTFEILASDIKKLRHKINDLEHPCYRKINKFIEPPLPLDPEEFPEDFMDEIHSFSELQ